MLAQPYSRKALHLHSRFLEWFCASEPISASVLHAVARQLFHLLCLPRHSPYT
jgi:hypothetical protein